MCVCLSWFRPREKERGEREMNEESSYVFERDFLESVCFPLWFSAKDRKERRREGEREIFDGIVAWKYEMNAWKSKR